VTREHIVTVFREEVTSQFELRPEGMNRYRVFTPFEFDDGDSLEIVLEHRDGAWVLTDEAHTFTRLTYDLSEANIREGTRKQITANALTAFGVEDREGELVLSVFGESFGEALFSFVQAILEIYRYGSLTLGLDGTSSSRPT